MKSKLANIAVIRSSIEADPFHLAAALPLTQPGTTTLVLTQRACWVDQDHLAVGRRDVINDNYSLDEGN